MSVFAAILVCNVWIVLSTGDRVRAEVDQIKDDSVVVVLGTSKKIGPSTPNPHFENRIAAAVQLFREGKAGEILVSGYRNSQYYDEAKDMKARLLEHDVPEKIILTDNRGDRTFDSITRARTEFGFDRVVIVSDRFHVHRALFIADRTGLDAVAFRSEPVPLRISGQTRFRECFARVKAVLDLYLISPRNSGNATWISRKWRSTRMREIRTQLRNQTFRIRDSLTRWENRTGLISM